MDPYAVLGIGPNASDEEVRKAYIARVHEHPPERDPEGFKTVRWAYEKVRDAGARALQFLDTFEEISLCIPDLPPVAPVPLSRRLILLADAHECEILRRDFSEDLKWPL